MAYLCVLWFFDAKNPQYNIYKHRNRQPKKNVLMKNRNRAKEQKAEYS